MSTISPREFTSKTGDPFTIRSARTDDAEVLIAYVKAITQESNHLIIQAD
jgi:hypothetical protein